jgi:glycine C-acetyltransferase
LYKNERVLHFGPQGEAGLVSVARQGAHVDFPGNLCANNYLGLANHPAVVAAAQAGLTEWGYGLASVRFICGTQRIHKQLEHAAQRVSRHRRHHPLQFLLRRQWRPV